MIDFAQNDGLLPPVSDRDHILGCKTASITLVEYGDYQCPNCIRFFLISENLQQNFGNHVRFVFRHFPQSAIHPRAFIAAEAVEAAGTQGKFWEMHQHLLKNQQALDDADLVQYAIELNLKMAPFLQEMSGHVHADRVKEDLESGNLNGVTGTPTFFINIRYEGTQNLEQLLSDILASISG